MSTSHEVFGNYDYEYAAERKRNPQKGLVQVLGERALTWFRGMNAKRKAEKAERQYNGSLEEISGAFTAPEIPAGAIGVYKIPEQPAPELRPHKMGEPGMYRSMNAIHSMEGPHAIDDQMARLMHGAVRRAREQMASDSTTETTTMRAVEPVEAPPEEARQDNDELVGSK